MSTCSNCYSGCSEITSDKCVKYTGVNIPVLGIQTGDSLSFVEQSLITFLTATIDGTGIQIDINDSLYCELVTQYLQECETVTALDLFKALVQAACSVQTQIDTINTTLTTLNADYDVDCLAGVTDSSDTHDVLQAVITKLCEINTDLTALVLDVDTNYVKISEVNSYIAAYIASTATADRYYTRMVPYAIQAYYGSLSNFDATGAGITATAWEQVYLCNGLNGTPDLRGRALVGAIVAVPGGALSSTVNPASSPFNPNYALGTLSGENSAILDVTQIPAHTHTINTSGAHTHTVVALATSDTGTGELVGGAAASQDASVNTSSDGTHTHTADNTGGGAAHSIVQPVIATYFIMYIPA